MATAIATRTGGRLVMPQQPAPAGGKLLAINRPTQPIGVRQRAGSLVAKAAR